MQKQQEKPVSIQDSVQIGDITLKNRFVVAPLTRCRANPKDGIPNDLMKEYYTSRTGYGLIITECSQVSETGTTFPGSGGIHSEEQVQGWKKIVDEVHAQNSKIFLQIWHCGRQCAYDFHDQDPIGPSPIATRGDEPFTKKPYPVPREMTLEDIDTVKEQFRKGAQNAKKAGFDGVELHGANGYLVDQFMRDGTNQRTDQYGGSIENRCRLMLEVMDILIEVFGSKRVAIRLSPTGRFGDMYDSNPIELMKYALKELEKRKLAFVEFKRHGSVDSVQYDDGNKKDKYGRELPKYQIENFFKTLRSLYSGVIMGNDGFDPRSAQLALENGELDLVSFGKLSIINPDMPQRVKNNWPLESKFDFNTFYEGGEKGYTDYKHYGQQN